MKQYVIDDLREPELARLKTWCAANLTATCFADVFWLNLDETVLNATQLSHQECRPLYLSVVLEAETGRMVIDMAVRTARSMHCECMGYLDAKQFAWLDGWVDTVFAGLGIRT